MTMPVQPRYLLVGLVAGLVSGLLGVGGGIVIVPMLILVGGFTQHQAHATSLAAVIPIATVGAATYAFDNHVDVGIAIALAAGAIVGAPIGARLMARMPEMTLKIVFGFILLAMGGFLIWS
jgi:hypothetical protein